MKNNLKEKLKDLIKKVGFESTIRVVGSLDKTFEIFDIKEPMDFLHLFDDLEVIQSEEKENWVLYRYKKGYNFMIYDRKNDYVYINYYEIWSVLEDKFGLKHAETQELTRVWLGEVYNLREVTPFFDTPTYANGLGEVYNLREVTPFSIQSFAGPFGWMRSTI